MECYNCGRGAGVACKYCERGICGRRGCGYFRHNGVIRCLNPDKYCLMKQEEARVTVVVTQKRSQAVNPMGQNHHCGSTMVVTKRRGKICPTCDGGTFHND